jgi:DhnA family fructose-bisphosphate aldolase class Ia
MVRAAMDAGASGATVGRNIWKAENPAGMAAALRAVIHDGARVEQALTLLAQ